MWESWPIWAPTEISGTELETNLFSLEVEDWLEEPKLRVSVTVLDFTLGLVSNVIPRETGNEIEASLEWLWFEPLVGDTSSDWTLDGRKSRSSWIITYPVADSQYWE